MEVIISMLRGVNVGGNHKIAMNELRALYESLGLETPRTHIQSGNVIFSTPKGTLPSLADRIESAIEQRFGFRPAVILRTRAEMRLAIDQNPFAAMEGIEPSKLLVTFLAADPGAEARARVRAIEVHPEQLHIIGRELYVYYPKGAGQTKFPAVRIGKILGTPGTARNLNTVLKLSGIAESLH